MEDVATLRVRAEFLVGRVESRTDVGDLLARQVATRQRIAAQLESRGDDSLLGVLVRLALSLIHIFEELEGPAVVVGNSMGAGAAAYAAAERPDLISGLVLVGPFVRNGKTTTMQRVLLRVAMARPWAAMSWNSCLLYTSWW